MLDIPECSRSLVELLLLENPVHMIVQEGELARARAEKAGGSSSSHGIASFDLQRRLEEALARAESYAVALASQRREVEDALAREHRALEQVAELTHRLKIAREEPELRGHMIEIRARNAELESALAQSVRHVAEVEVRYQILKERVLKKYRDQGRAVRSGAPSVAGPAEPARRERTADTTFRSLDDLISVTGFCEAQAGGDPRGSAREGSVASRPPQPRASRTREDEGSSHRHVRPRDEGGEGGDE